MSEKDVQLVLLFLEECQEHGSEYAENRLWQRWKFTKYRLRDVNQAVEEVERLIEHKYRTERIGYQVVILLGAIACIADLAGITNTGLPDSVRLALCIIAPGAMILIRSYLRHLKDVVRRRSKTRKDLEALHPVFAGLLEA